MFRLRRAGWKVEPVTGTIMYRFQDYFSLTRETIQINHIGLHKDIPVETLVIEDDEYDEQSDEALYQIRFTMPLKELFKKQFNFGPDGITWSRKKVAMVTLTQRFLPFNLETFHNFN